MLCHRCNLELSLKPFGLELDEDDLIRLDTAIDGKGVLQQVYELLPTFTVHITAESMPAFMGMRPGGVSPFTPKV
jgi:hypothetical protein